MSGEEHESQALALAFAAAWNRLERRLSTSLGAIRGVSLAEYRLLRTLADSPDAQSSRVELAYALGITPSGITRALRPLEKLGMVTTVKSKRDARLAIAALTTAGRQAVNDASGVVDDSMAALLRNSPELAGHMQRFIGLLNGLAR